MCLRSNSHTARSTSSSTTTNAARNRGDPPAAHDRAASTWARRSAITGTTSSLPSLPHMPDKPTHLPQSRREGIAEVFRPHRLTVIANSAAEPSDPGPRIQQFSHHFRQHGRIPHHRRTPQTARTMKTTSPVLSHSRSPFRSGLVRGVSLRPTPHGVSSRTHPARTRRTGKRHSSVHYGIHQRASSREKRLENALDEKPHAGCGGDQSCGVMPAARYASPEA